MSLLGGNLVKRGPVVSSRICALHSAMLAAKTTGDRSVTVKDTGRLLSLGSLRQQEQYCPRVFWMRTRGDCFLGGHEAWTDQELASAASDYFADLRQEVQFCCVPHLGGPGLVVYWAMSAAVFTRCKRGSTGLPSSSIRNTTGLPAVATSGSA